MLNICDFIQVCIFTTNHHLKVHVVAKLTYLVAIICGHEHPGYHLLSDL